MQAAKKLRVVAMCALTACTLAAGAQRVSTRVADEAMARWPGGHIGAKDAAVAWGFEPGAVLAGFNAEWQATKDPRFFHYIQSSVDQFVQPDGTIRTYDAKAYSLNNILIGRQLLMLYAETHEDKYRKAADLLYAQMLHQPKTKSGGWWHAQATPDLMLLDDTFMYAPFLAEYAATFHHPEILKAVALQFSLLYEHARDPKTGLLYHGWDEGRTRPWVDKSTGDSATLWARGMGWYMMALADTLPLLPKQSAEHAQMEKIFRETAAALVKAQDAKSGLWFQIMDAPDLKDNYIESSSVMMLTYALAKGARTGELPASYTADAKRAWAGIEQRFVQTAPDGTIVISGTVTHISLGAAPENNGTHEYYLQAPVVSDDPKGVGAFLLVSTEMERAKK